MPDNRTKAIQFSQKHMDDYLTTLKEFIRIPSISNDNEQKSGIDRAASWLEGQLRDLGCENVTIFPTPKHPVVYGEWLKASNAPTALIYGHYDVQPVDPLNLWQSDPFEPTQRGEHLYARGASDMKGQIAVVLSAIDASQKAGDFPLNIKFLFEGEEEIGSPNLKAFLVSHRDLLECDFVLNPDASMISADIPTIVYGLRGLAYLEIRLYGPEHDLHSGMFGGVVLNPAQVLCELVAGLHDSSGRVTLPGFYDKVLPLEEEERKELARLPMDEDFYKLNAGVSELWGEKGYSAVERVGARPSLDVNGLLSGFIGEGSKTVLPAYAMAKISTRLVANQTPDDVYHQLQEYLRSNTPAAIRWEILRHSGGFPSISSRDSKEVHALYRALETVFKKAPVFKREGGSIPVVADMQEVIGVDSVLTGFGLLDDNIHAPNEKLHLPTWKKGIETMIHFFYNVVES